MGRVLSHNLNLIGVTKATLIILEIITLSSPEAPITAQRFYVVCWGPGVGTVT